ncbi:MAG: hypothetical protein IE933_13640 [Sphingomonadales bacterium]|nr:hypothetical protein [Sphingomonadales bacterium]MBD3774991.1 hypothetical protein [Paracoccaceae bacterium]
MPLMQLQLIMIALAIILVAIVARMVLSRVTLPAMRRPAFALPAIPRPSLGRLKRAAAASDADNTASADPVALAPSRLERLQYRQEEAAAPIFEEAAPYDPAQDPQFFAHCEMRLEALFNRFESGAIDIAQYRAALSEELATTKQVAARLTAGPEAQWGEAIRREAMLEQAREAREKIDWCIQWTQDFARSAWDDE